MPNLKEAVGGNVPLASDLNQLVEAFSGFADGGALSLFGGVSDPAAPTAALNTASGNLAGTYSYLVALATGWKSSDGSLHINGFAPGQTASGTVAAAEEQVNLTALPTGTADSSNQYGTVARILYRLGVVTPPASALSLSLVTDSTSTLAATTYYVDYAFYNTHGDTTVGSSEASIAIGTADADDIRFSVTFPAGSADLSGIIVGLGTASGGESQYAQVSTAAAVTYVGTNSAGVSATVSGSTITVTIKAPQSDTSHAMPSSNTAYLASTTSSYGFVAAIGDNTTTTWTDNLVDTSVGSGMPTSSSATPWYGTAVPSTIPSANTTGSSIAVSYGATAPPNAVAGALWVNTAVSPSLLSFYNGSSWVTAGGASATTTQAGVVEVEQTTTVTPVAGTVVASTTHGGEVEITGTTAQTVASYTPSRQGNFLIAVYFRVVTGTTTVTVQATYDDGTGAQTLTILNASSEALGSYAPLLVMVHATTAAAINVQVTASVANQVYASASILGV